jgi:hypothetical protein
MKRFAAPLASLLLVLLYGTTARADLFDLGDISAGDIKAETRVILGADVAFDDTWMFTLTDPLFTSAEVVRVDIGQLSGIQIDSVTSPDFTFVEVESDVFSFEGGELDAGPYEFRVQGHTTGQSGGTYAVGVAAIPEPQTAALLALGLVVLAAQGHHFRTTRARLRAGRAA